VAFALRLREATGICTVGDVGLLPKVVQAERRASSVTREQIETTLEQVPGYESPFVSTSGRSTPEWLKEA
jgi:hypothetical protein